MSGCPPLPSEVLQASKEGRLVLFLGAGLSCASGLSDWPSLMRELIDEFKPKSDEGAEALKKELRAEPNYYKCFTQIQNNDPDAYERIMKKNLVPSQQVKQKFKTLFTELKKLGPTSIVTLNVDCLLAEHTEYETIRKIGDCWPWEIQDGRVFFFHGIIDHRGRDTYGWVFNDAELKKRYEQSLDASRFLYGLFSGFYTILFVGFSFSDDQLIKFAEIPPITQKEIENKERPFFHYALLPSNADRAIGRAKGLGIRPLLYTFLPDAEPKDRHSNFEKTLSEWGANATPTQEDAFENQAIPEGGPTLNV